MNKKGCVENFNTAFYLSDTDSLRIILHFHQHPPHHHLSGQDAQRMRSVNKKGCVENFNTAFYLSDTDSLRIILHFHQHPPHHHLSGQDAQRMRSVHIIRITGRTLHSA